MWTAGSLTLNLYPPEALSLSPSEPIAVVAPDAPPELHAASVAFEQPWQAQIFALVVQLHQRGVFSWPEWSATLGDVLAQEPSTDPAAPLGACAVGAPGTKPPGPEGQAAKTPSDPAWDHWPVALERLLVRRGIAAPGALVALRQAWQMADESTPHGQPVRLGSAVRRLSGGYAPDAGSGSAVEPAHGRTP